jgi:hypothetical protein
MFLEKAKKHSVHWVLEVDHCGGKNNDEWGFVGDSAKFVRVISQQERAWEDPRT